MGRKAKDVKFYNLYFRPPLPTWRKDRLVLIGDAAHPMLPRMSLPQTHVSYRIRPLKAPSHLTKTKVQGQGGAQAIEDGAALGIVFSSPHFSSTNTDLKSIEEKLSLFEKIRRPRASVIQMLSNAGQEEMQKIKESVLPYWVGDGEIPSSFPFWF